MQETVEARVLLVSSDPEQVRHHADRLSGVGYVVRACGPDADGFSLFDQFDPQVTVVDLSAGSPDAFDFLERGRRIYPTCGFLGLTESPPPPPVGEARVAPQSPEAEAADLVPLVERALERSRVNRDAARFKNRAETILSQARFDEII